MIRYEVKLGRAGVKRVKARLDFWEAFADSGLTPPPFRDGNAPVAMRRLRGEVYGAEAELLLTADAYFLALDFASCEVYIADGMDEIRAWSSVSSAFKRAKLYRFKPSTHRIDDLREVVVRHEADYGSVAA